ncbi:hypothetical protein FEM48_Zijuj02G0107600 [Ziziphus jujuba var. spinosa]|uniref:ADP/ATP translocase n=1 Tax=Ziziphus jujuba var. spinosa TaxID=714518 RepID=A0A978VVA2_ZIZJJ|nr:hypothetical protein FEM48_Zijuj02G0107600 [Ziziphus jujuba var. spinosa]
MFAGNLASGGAASASSLLFVYSLDYARTHLANDAKAAKKGGERQFNGLVDVYRKTMKSSDIVGLYRGFNISLLWNERFSAASGFGWKLAGWIVSLLVLHLIGSLPMNEGAKSLFKGANANILHAVAGAGVLIGYDNL